VQANRLVVLVGRQWRRGWRRTQSASRSRRPTGRCSKWASSRTVERRLVERAQIVLLAGEGRSASEIAERVGCVPETARRQRARYEREGLEGLRDRPRSERPMTHDQGVRARLIALACTRPPNTEQGRRPSGRVRPRQPLHPQDSGRREVAGRAPTLAVRLPSTPLGSTRSRCSSRSCSRPCGTRCSRGP